MDVPEVPFKEIKTESEFRKKLINLKDFEVLKILDVPSTLNASELFLKPWFLQNLNQISSFYCINFIIKQPLSIEDLQFNRFITSQRKILATFESTLSDEIQMTWKLMGIDEKLYSLNVSRNLKDFVWSFLSSSLRNNSLGVLNQNSSQITIQSLRDARGYNMLMLAAEQNQQEVVIALIKLKRFNLNEKVGGVTAVDLAWNGGHFEAVQTLLNDNSIYPTNFDVQRASKSIQQLVTTSNRLHELIRTHDDLLSDNTEHITEVITQNPNLRHFFNLANESAAFLALKLLKFDLYDHLVTKNVIIARTDPANQISDTLQKISLKRKRKIRDIHKKHARELPEKHLMKLIINSFVGADDSDNNKRLIYVSDAYNVLDKIPLIQPLLELVSNAGKFEVFFDFNRDSVEFLDPTSDASTNGKFFFSGVVYVAAKQLLDPARKFEAIGVLAHELCHYAMFLVYRNMAKSYPVFDFAAEQAFDETLAECKLNSAAEKIVRWVFECYDEAAWHAELIVRIPHMLAHYFNDSARLQVLRQTFSSLFDNFELVVLPQVRAAIPVLKKITEDPQSIKWEDLTPELQATIKHEEVNFQGENEELFNIVGENSAVYGKLSSDQILKLINSDILDISRTTDDELKFFVERKLISESHSRSLDEIVAGLERVLVLSDFAGAGKTTALKKLNVKLKAEYPCKWIQFVDLKRHFDAYEKCQAQRFANFEEISEFLACKVLKLDALESEIFSQLFKSDEVVLLFDGVDEISPSFNELACELFTAIKDLTNNVQWISTRPECANKLEEMLSVTIYRFLPYTKPQRSEFFEKYLTNSGLRLKILQERVKFAENFITEVEKDSVEGKRDVLNPLMLQMIADASADQKLSSASNFFLIVNWFITRNLGLIANKGIEVQRDRDNTIMKSMTLMQVHQVYALKLIFYSSKHYAQLDLFRKKIDWTNEEVNRYGILYIESDNFYTFAHRIFAEFFCARLLIDGVYELKDQPTSEEAELRLKLLINSARNHSEIFNFILNYIDLTLNSEGIHQIYLDLMLTKHKNIFLQQLISKEDISILTRFFQKSRTAIDAIWMLSEDQNLLVHSMHRDTTFESEEVIEIAEKLLTDDQREKLFNLGHQRGNVLYYLWSNKERQKCDKNLLQLDEETIEGAVDQKTLLDFLNFVEPFLNNFEMREILIKNSVKILAHDLETGQELEDLWVKITKTLTLNEIKHFLLGENCNFRQNFFNFDSYYSNFLIHGASDGNFFKILFTKLEEFLEEVDISVLVSTTDKFLNSPLSTTVMNNKDENYKHFWELIDRNLNVDDRKRLLMMRNKHDQTAFYHAIIQDDLVIFEFFRKIYEAHFTCEELRKIIKDPSLPQVPFYHLISDHDYPLKNIEIFVEFLESLFNGSKNELIGLLCREGYEWNLFHAFDKFNDIEGRQEEFEVRQQKLTVFANLIKKFVAEDSFESFVKENKLEKFYE